GLARPGNAAALISILAEAHRTEIQMARPENAASPPSDPLTALTRAGLGLALAHGAGLILFLFLAEGTRLGKTLPDPPKTRRAFVEPVLAVSAVYDRAKASRHALARFGSFAIDELRARMPRGEGDLTSFVSSRTGRSREECDELLREAAADRSGD